ncbi:type VI secretion system protein [Pseudomonas fontis]|uniref:Type VI secretion system protein ImpL n=1 Tax=Pseudomonas fontis TaxID=2942633 RepID=A0ABT5NTV4_9PSED|nr:type VI secretion protein IcmF/TssM N-terminal domain-containing protein [Pseudomonas fontis]MDD0974511.1 type VI secretion system protein ImpL [Pseudomonas fontis]MDD0991605.1 type VI secretion system protein ImpL [Pseudomonas fontis]
MSLSWLAWVIGIVLVLLVVLLCLWWLRNRNGVAIRSFYYAVRQMEHDQGVRNRYQAPWVLMVGDEVQGARLCASWNLRGIDKPAWFGRWWSDPNGAVLVVPQSLFMPGEGMQAQSSGWWNLLGLFLRIRARRPLDAVIWTIAAADLLDTEKAATLGLEARRRFIDLLQRLGIRLPVYVVVTGMDQLPGFQELISVLPQEDRQQVLGWSAPFAPDVAWQSQWSDRALDEIIQALSEAIIQVGTLNGQLPAELGFLPQRLDGLRRNLQLLLWPVFQGNTHGEAPAFRGLYFTASHAGQADAEALSALDSPLAQEAFAQQLWQQRINAERGLAQPIPRLLQLRQRWQRMTALGLLVVGVCWMVAMIWVWQRSVRDAGELSRLLQNAQSEYVVISDDNHRQELTRHNVKAFWTVLEHAPRWHFASLVYPSSWFSSLDDRLDKVLQHTSMSHMHQPIHDLLQAQLRALLAINDTARRGAPEGSDPAQWPSYLKARELVQKVTHLEQISQLYAQALSNQKTPLDELIPLSNLALDLNLNAGTLPRAAYYNRLLVEKGPSPLKPLDLSMYRSAISANFNALMANWLGHYFRTENFVSSAGYLKLYLDRIENGQPQTLKELEHLDSLVEDLQASIDLTNATWGRGKGQDLVAGYTELMEKVRQSKVLGPAQALEVERLAEQMQYRFKDQWIAQSASSKNLMIQSGSGQLAFQERITQLQSAINLLLKRDFVARSLREEGANAPEQLSNVDSDGLRLALNYYDSYKLYAHESLPGIPPVYRNALLKTAENTAADAMWLSLNRHSAQDELERPPMFEVRADQALSLHKAFIQLQRPDLASSLQSYLNQSALTDITQGLDSVFEQPLFSDRANIGQWDGSKDLGLRLFRAVDVQDLKGSLEQQFTVIAKITELHTPAMEWLMTQQSSLTLADAAVVTRFHSLSEEMSKYKAQNPSSSPALIAQLIVRDFNEMDDASCQKILLSATAPHATGQLAQRWVSLQQTALQRCQVLQRQAVSSAWNTLAGYFNQYLAGRFPFSNDLRAADADPARVQYLLSLIDSHLPLAQDGLRQLTSAERGPAQAFLERLAQARPWLGAMLMRDPAGLSGVDLEVRWRTDRDSERGADQVISWTLGAGNREIAHPGEDQVLHWNVGQPVNLRLRWAKDGTQRPVNDPLQQQLHVSGVEAEWYYRGPWALLRLMNAHGSRVRQPNLNYTEFPLSLEVPVHAQPTEVNQTLMFLRLSLMSQGGKAPLAIHPLPEQAPLSPFGYEPRSLADSGEQP